MTDLLYYYSFKDIGCIAFLHSEKDSGLTKGWSRKMSDTKLSGWHWAQAEEFYGNPVGARCLIQW